MLNRRSFLIASGLTALASTRVLGANDTVRVGVIGAGGRMRNLLDAADKVAPYEIVAVSDVYTPHRDAVRERSNGIATTHLDYREVLEKDIDAVFIASPDHWHVRMAVDALAAGKDVYLEKPVTHTLEEGAVLTRAVRSSKRILQCGMQQRSWTHFKDAVELIQGAVWDESRRCEPIGGRTIIGTGLPNPSTCKRSIGSCGSGPLPISRSLKRSSITGAGSGISAAAP